MSTAGTFEDFMDKAIKECGKTVEQVAEMIGISRRALFRHKSGENKAPGDCVARMVDSGIAPPEILPVYCHAKCPVGQARDKYHLKRSQKKKKPRFFNQSLRQLLKRLYPRTA